MKSRGVTSVRVGAAHDAAGVAIRPARVIVENGRIIAVGPDAPGSPHGSADRRIDLPDRLLLPAFVNAHAHLELTAIGPRPYTGSFVDWLGLILKERPKDDVSRDAAVRSGGAMLRDSGVASVGDIGGAAASVLHGMGLAGVMFHEMIGHAGDRVDEQCAALTRIVEASTAVGGMRPGIQPHAPYTSSRRLYEAALRHDLPLSTHLAETTDEARFIADAAGPFREHFDRTGFWRSEDSDDYGQGMSPVRWMQPYLERAPWLLAHCNYVSDDDIALLAQTGASVAYCPIASEYFGHRDHGYRDMLAAGVNVCLGTDSIVCQPADEPQPLGVLPQLRRLYRRDGTDPVTLLAMATTNGLRALRMNETDATLVPGAPARFALAPFDPKDDTDPLIQILTHDSYAEAYTL